MFRVSVCLFLVVRAFGRLPYRYQIADTWGFAETLGCPHTDVVGVLISLEAEEMVKSKLLQTMYFVVSSEGQQVGSWFFPSLPHDWAVIFSVFIFACRIFSGQCDVQKGWRRAGARVRVRVRDRFYGCWGF